MKALRIICLLLAVLVLSVGCSAEKTTTFFAMDTVMSVTCKEEDAAIVREEILRLDALLDANDPDSALAQYNEGATAPEELSALIDASRALCAQTDGALDITLRPASLLWGFGTEESRVPTQAELDALKDQVGWEKQNIPVDLGAVAKGYAADRAAELLRQNGVTSAILSLGGNIRVLGSKPNGSAYTIGIQDPQTPDALVASIAVTDTSVVTSGSYQRYFEADGKRYHHILDPATLRPAESGLCSVTIVCESGFYADALSTALFVKGKDAAISFYRAAQDFDMILIDTDCNVFYTAGLSLADCSEGKYIFHVIN